MSLVYRSLNITGLGIVGFVAVVLIYPVWHLLRWFDLWFGVFIWKVHCFSKHFFCSRLSFFTLYSHYTYAVAFAVVPHFLESFVVVVLFSLYFSLGSFYWPIFNLTDSFFGNVQSTNKPIKGIIYLCYSVFDFSHFPFDSFLVFPSLYLHYPSVLAYSLFLHLSP